MRRVPEDNELKSAIEAQVLSIVTVCLEREPMTRQAIMEALGVRDTPEAARTLKRRLALAVEWGWLRREGESRATTYAPTEAFRHVMAMRHIAKPLLWRPKVTYDISLLEGYEPNRSFYLTKEQRDHLHAVCCPGSFNCKDPAQAQMIRRFMADLSHHSALLEGVRANYVDTIQLLEENIHSRNLSERDAVILRNLYNAARLLVSASGYPSDPRDFAVRERDVCQIHAIVSDSLLHDIRDQGRLRCAPVEIAYSQYLPPGIPDQIQSAFRLLIEKAQAIEDPFEQSFFLNAHIPYLQPFVDCNKRTARVACNIPLLNKGVLPISWREVTPRDYHDALLCLYEKKSFYGMAQVFVEAFLRSAERFRAEQKERQPSRLEVTYSREIEQVIRRRVLDGDESYRPSMPDEDWNYIQGYIASVLRAALENDMVLAPYRIFYEDWEKWRNEQLEKIGASEQWEAQNDNDFEFDAPSM